MQHHLYIHGAYVGASSSEVFETINPATGEVIAEVAHASEADVEKAVISAEQGFAVWSTMPAVERSVASVFNRLWAPRWCRPVHALARWRNCHAPG